MSTLIATPVFDRGNANVEVKVEEERGLYVTFKGDNNANGIR